MLNADLLRYAQRRFTLRLALYRLGFLRRTYDVLEALRTRFDAAQAGIVRRALAAERVISPWDNVHDPANFAAQRAYDKVARMTWVRTTLYRPEGITLVEPEALGLSSTNATFVNWTIWSDSRHD